MIININKDFEKAYKDDAWRGFSLKEVICILIALMFLSGVIFLLWKIIKLPPDIAVYIGMPFTIPILAVGFFKYKEMSPMELIVAMRYEWKTRLLCYDADEIMSIPVFILDTESSSKKERRKRKNGTFQKYVFRSKAYKYTHL